MSIFLLTHSCFGLRPTSHWFSCELTKSYFRHFACCLGDTLASELGILSKTPPILLTTLSRVPPGTNGGLSLLGTVASISGGAAMGLTMFATLVAENSSCREQTASLFWQLLLLGAGAGGFGSLVSISGCNHYVALMNALGLWPACTFGAVV